MPLLFTLHWNHMLSYNMHDCSVNGVSTHSETPKKNTHWITRYHFKYRLPTILKKENRLRLSSLSLGPLFLKILMIIFLIYGLRLLEPLPRRQQTWYFTLESFNRNILTLQSMSVESSSPGGIKPQKEFQFYSPQTWSPRLWDLSHLSV